MKTSLKILIFITYLFACAIFSDQIPAISSVWSDVQQQNNQIQLSEGEKRFLQSHPIIRFGIDETWDPYVVRGADGILRGFDVDLIRYINETAGNEYPVKHRKVGGYGEKSEKT